jgi:hypothetical protein
VISSIVEIALVSRTFQSYSSESFARSIAHHREMIAAFRMRDDVWAASIMTSHIRAAYHVFLTTVPADDPDHKRLDTGGKRSAVGCAKQRGKAPVEGHQWLEFSSRGRDRLRPDWGV